MGLEVLDTNNNPTLIAKYLNSLNEIGKTPRISRCNVGTEKCVCLLQHFFGMIKQTDLQGVEALLFERALQTKALKDGGVF